jgi:hypothetical protein
MVQVGAAVAPRCAALRCNVRALCCNTSRRCSESGKLITQLFARINAMLDDPDTFLCLLIGPKALRTC